MKILVAHDGSEKADKALDVAAGIAGKSGATLVIVNVVPDLCLSSEEIGAEGCARISFATGMSNLTKALERIAKVVAG